MLDIARLYHSAAIGDVLLPYDSYTLSENFPGAAAVQYDGVGLKHGYTLLQC